MKWFLCFVSFLQLLVGARARLFKKANLSWVGNTIEDFWAQYDNIFPSSNRNAAAFKWSSFLFQHSASMTAPKFEMFATSYCAVAASIVRPTDFTRYHVSLPVVSGGTKSGYLYFCCWPCICDTRDFLQVDTKTVTLEGGVTRQYNFVVMGDPCNNKAALEASYTDPFYGNTETLQQTAPEVQCGPNGLVGATKSDNGHIIMAMFFDDAAGLTAKDEGMFEGACSERAAGGYKSGMGLIFRKVAGASPLPGSPAAFHAMSNASVRGDSRIVQGAINGSAASNVKKNPEACPCKQAGLAKAALLDFRNLSSTK